MGNGQPSNLDFHPVVEQPNRKSTMVARILQKSGPERTTTTQREGIDYASEKRPVWSAVRRSGSRSSGDTGRSMESHRQRTGNLFPVRAKYRTFLHRTHHMKNVSPCRSTQAIKSKSNNIVQGESDKWLYRQKQRNWSPRSPRDQESVMTDTNHHDERIAMMTFASAYRGDVNEATA